jgi:hypothetical protein
MATHHQQILALVVTRTYIYTQAYISVIGAHTTCHVTTWPADNMTFGFDLQEARAMIDEAQAQATLETIISKVTGMDAGDLPAQAFVQLVQAQASSTPAPAPARWPLAGR